MKPPGLASDSSTRHPAIGSRMWCNAGALDEVEALRQRAELQDVGLGEAQVGEPELGAAPHRVGEARAADVHGEHLAVGLELRGDGGMPPGTAAGDEYPRRVGRRELRRVGVREERAQHAAGETRPARRALPARIRVGFVLRLHAARHIVRDGGERSEREAAPRPAPRPAAATGARRLRRRPGFLFRSTDGTCRAWRAPKAFSRRAQAGKPAPLPLRSRARRIR